MNVVAVVGATGTGKSALAEALARRLGGEIINADSMQVYRGMDIGTAKVPPEQRGVPYHCLDIVEPGETFTAALYQRAARAAIDDCLARGVVPVVCGGTGLYIRAALDEFALDEHAEESVGAVLTARDALTTQATTLGAEAFHALLARRDPVSAALIHPNNVRRVVRAFELLEGGSSYAEQSAGFSAYTSHYPTTYIGITVEPEVLYGRVNARVDAMMAAGLLDEVRRLLAEGFAEALTAQQAIGYKELVPVLRGEATLEDAVAAIKQATRRYAKRQRTWFKRDPRIAWLDATTLTPDTFTETLQEQAMMLL
jgi:tRNA dimethylallyltransferase